MQQDEILKDIRRRCRMAMNGVASTSMRNHGLNYKLNFGVDIKKIKEIAARYTPDANLAETLWLDGTRELKILATLLYPTDLFTIDRANAWVTQIPNQEIREQLSVNLLQSLSFADNIASQWCCNQDADIRTTGYWLSVRRLLAKQVEGKLDISGITDIWSDIESDNVSLRNAAILFLKNAGKTDASLAEHIIQKLSVYKDSDDAFRKEIYDSLSFEFDFHYGR